MSAPIIHWFRRDLRLRDNPGLRAAVNAGGKVIPAFILSTWAGRHAWTGAPRQQFLCDCLGQLDASLRQAGSRLILRDGPAPEALLKLARETGAKTIHAGRSPDPFGRAEEARLQKLTNAEGITLRLFDDCWLVPPDALQTSTGKPYRVFTPYARRWVEVAAPAEVAAIRRLPDPGKLASKPLPTLARWGLELDAQRREAQLPGGEMAARKRLKLFVQNHLGNYGQQRDRPGAAGTSRLSADLRHGTLSIREVVARAREFAETSGSQAEKRAAQVWINELAWRDFYFQVLWHWPEVLEQPFNPKFAGLQWNPARGKAWEAFQAGQTGFPLVDAGIRQLLATGWMHNRLRMVVAMFLCKDLRIHWRHGEAFFLRHLIDGEIASNNGGWQWSAGTGADAAPYFRIQNPWTQAKRHDPHGEFIRRWLPELAETKSADLFRPPPPGTSLAAGYPAPIVDHARERARTLEWFRGG